MGSPEPTEDITLSRVLKESGPPCGLLIIYLLAFFLFGAEWMLPGKPGFSLYVCWVAGLVGGRLMSTIGQPPLLGMLIGGIILRNVGKPSLVDALPNAWGSAVRVFGLSVILMRSGLELDLGAIARIGAACVRLTVCPGCSEAVMVALAAFVIFGMPLSLALSLGFILAAVSPAVVVGGMFDLQRRGYGIAKGIPSLVVAAASFDDVVAITGYSLCIGFAISTGHSNVLWEAMHGPINVGLGLALGFLGGYFIAISDMWDTPAKRTIIVALVGLTFAYGCSSIHFTGAGALASLVTTCVAARQWGLMATQSEAKAREKAHGGENDDVSEESTSEQSDGASSKHWATHVEHHLAEVWKLLAQPLLFCVIGSALDFSQLDAGTIPMSVVVVICGVLVRCPVAGFVLFGTKLTKQERSFVGLAWIPKATVQAALGGIPLDIVRTSIDPHHDPELFAKYEKWGLQILTTAVLSILITAPIGLLVIQNLGHRWLSKDIETKSVGDAQTKGSTTVDEEGHGGQGRLAKGRRNTMEMKAEILKEFRPCDPESGEDKAVNIEDVFLEDLPTKEQLKAQEEDSIVHEDMPKRDQSPKKDHTQFETLGSLFSLRGICGGTSSRE